ncbi:hypothetical protein Tco_1111132 [Tanacetum coccineum]|uniref:Uncharacterized protein n=1 Tax=Tanacetum coccineum TaxID=301880 RepID=A0ABQ5IND8_9ASTR
MKLICRISGLICSIQDMDSYNISGKISSMFSILLTPLRCDDTHDVTPRVSALAGCDSIEDPKEEQIEEEPLEKPREKG